MSTGGATQIVKDTLQGVIQTLINGGDESSWATISDMAAAVNDGPNPLDFLIFRGATGYGDDQAYTKNSAMAKSVVVKNKDGSARGSLLWGSYMFLGYGPGSNPGASQAANFWSLIDAGGSHYWQVPPSIDVERETYIANGVRQYVPLPSVETYLDTRLMPAIDYLEGKTGRLPIVYLNLDMALHYLKPAYGNPKYAKLFRCPLWLAVWSSTVPSAGILSPMWTQWAFWQKKGDIHDNPGTSDIDYNEWPGDRASLKAWCNDPAFPIPPYTTNTPPPPPPPPVPTTETWATILVSNLKIRTAPDTSTEANRIGTGYSAAKFKVTEKKVVGNITFVRPELPVWMAAQVGTNDPYIKLEDKPIQK